MSTNIGEKLERIASIMDSIDELDAAAAPLKKERAALEGEVLKLMRESGQEKAGSATMTASLRSKITFNYDPAKFNDIMASLLAAGYGHCIQRRLTDGKIEEMIESGLPLPDGLSAVPIQLLSVRRRSAPGVPVPTDAK